MLCLIHNHHIMQKYSNVYFKIYSYNQITFIQFFEKESLVKNLITQLCENMTYFLKM